MTVTTVAIHRRKRHPAPGFRIPINPDVRERVCYIAAEAGRKVSLRYAPLTVTHTGLTPVWTATPRVGRKPLNQRGDDQLRTMSFDVYLASPDWTASHESPLAVLRVMAQEGQRMTVSLSALERGLWRMTDLSLVSEERQPGTKAVTRATATLTFTEVSDFTPLAGVTTGGARKVTSKGKRKAGGHVKHRKAHKYRVVAGDTLARIAAREMGSATLYPLIARANHIRDVRVIHPGTVLTIPAT